MRSAILLALGSTAVASPLGDVFNVVFGREPAPHTRDFPLSKPVRPFPTGTGSFPTRFASPTRTCGGTGTAPAGTGFFSALPNGPIPSKSISIDYDLAPTVTYIPEIEKRQGTALPSFSLVNPEKPGASGLPSGTPTSGLGLPFPSGTDVPELPLPTPSQTGADPELPTPTSGLEPPFPFPTRTGRLPGPTGGVPTGRPRPTSRPSGRPGRPSGRPSGRPTGRPSGVPTGRPRPTGGRPSFPSTLATRTRGPRPTAIPQPSGLPAQGEEGQNWWEQLQGWLEKLRGGNN
ncbi:hypothetical protein B0J11DRAFT_49329 [Dendryphion nanum]|uniref:Uncharacterized protein n=1 Tax=Dendryphion nanum TaxID=256645 RepID=A0A9P9IG82_9PLEO|nr:hypothetical protein B0J11DRAFT_49329 [Dendryphion nanum]